MSSIVRPVILSGGAGTRLWPLSRASQPKQFLDLQLPGAAQGQSLLQQTAQRLPATFAAPMVVCQAPHWPFVVQQIGRTLGGGGQILTEPMGRNTTAAITVAALQADPNDVLVVLPSDHLIESPAAFHKALGVAVRAAEAGALVTLGIPPTHPETGYGYIRQGSPHPRLGEDGVYTLAAFMEKPPLAMAQKFLQEGGYLWNSGIFIFHRQVFLDEVARLQPEVLRACHAAIETGQRQTVDGIPILHLAAESFATAPAISVDYGIMEHTAQALVVPAPHLGWSDVGSWQALWAVSGPDHQGNVLHGEVIAQDVQGCYIEGQGRLVAALGVEDLTIVATPDAVYVGRQDRSQDMRLIMDQLQAKGRPEAHTHGRVHRPWGWYEILGQGPGYQIKRLHVYPGEQLSLQQHQHRQEVWVVVQGQAFVTQGETLTTLQSTELSPGQTCTIPQGQIHRLENRGSTPLEVMETQWGAYLGEDDIVRFEDKYQRPARRAAVGAVDGDNL